VTRIDDNHDARCASLVSYAPVNFVVRDALRVSAKDCFVIAVRFITGSDIRDTEAVGTHAENDGGIP
jgi:hypothetical protein